MAEEREFDPRLVMDANRSFSFIFRSFDAFRTSPDQTIGALMAPHVKGAGCDLINPGLVLAACYIYFVYPREATIASISLNGLDLASFAPRPSDPRELLRRLRNSLSHGRFSIDADGFFMFRDQRPDGTDVFSTRIHFTQLGQFVDTFGELAVKHFGRVLPSTIH